MKTQFYITMTCTVLLLNTFSLLEGRPFTRSRTPCCASFYAPAVAGPSSFNPYEATYAREEYTYEYDNSPSIYANRAYDTGLNYYDHAGTRAGTMNRYNGYYNTSFLAGTYTSGVSSYPGTTTGPGISNGYHGTPKGIYYTDSRYYDRNIRVHPDNHERFRAF
jgi:hypothetical protein